jgi:phage terminase Nu1 subunit (DNA packaging protein)
MSDIDNDTIKTTDISSVTVSAQVLGQIIGVTDRRIRQLAEENILVRISKGRYNLHESIKNYILTLKVAMETGNNDNPDGELDLDEEKALHERVKRHIAELKLQVMKGELHKSTDVERVMTDMLVAVRTKLLALPSKLAPILVSRNDIGFIKDTVSKEILEVLNELCDYNPVNFYSDEYVEVDGDDGDE